MRYFEGHEKIYARHIAAGRETWDEGSYDAFAMRGLIDQWLASSPAAKRGARVLELGCGTGALSCMLAQRGFSVTGLDISKSAISVARGVAQSRKLDIRFEVTEVCAWAAPARDFDIIVDSHLLHCIAHKSERRALLERILGSLSPNGEFWTETMCFGSGATFPARANHRIDESGIVWRAVSDPAKWSDAVQDSTGWWIPTRYIATGAHALLAEFADAGFKVIEWSVAPPSKEGDSADFRARLSRFA